VVTLYQASELKLRELVTRTYHLDGINDALAALAKVRAASSAGDTVALACFVILQ